ncbi:MAG: PD-(D/E)XK nuclease family protein, partial [Nostoc sp.]
AGIYEFYQDPLLLSQSEAVEEVAAILKLSQEPEEVQERIIQILNNYCKKPILVGKQIIQLSKGDEEFPLPITIQQGNYSFALYAPTDCTFKQPDGTIHILDFKT